jgi:NAD(P)-dependent dehydrogenase (short-subunit alcohol dehydrogenase family)
MGDEMTRKLAGRSALVTGSTSGIGIAIARALANEGAHVIIHGRDEARGKQAVLAITDAGGKADFLSADLGAGAEAIRGLAEEAFRIAGGALDILVNNAAKPLGPVPTAEVTQELIEEVLAVNVTAPLLLTGFVAPAMAERGGGVIVNIGSLNGLVGLANSVLYTASKTALHSMTKVWAAEFGPAGVRVNTIAPGPTLTEPLLKYMDQIQPMIDSTPSRRITAPEEVAATVVFLASGEARNIVGATISVDGGLAIR